MSGAPATVAIFWLKNSAGWRDQQHVDQTTEGQPIPLLAGIAPDRLEVEDDDDGGPASADDSAHEDKQSWTTLTHNPRRHQCEQDPTKARYCFENAFASYGLT